MGGRGTDDSSQPPGMGSDRQASGTNATEEAGRHGLSARKLRTGTGETARWANTVTQDQGPEGSDPQHSSKKRGVFTPVTPALGRQRQTAVPLGDRDKQLSGPPWTATLEWGAGSRPPGRWTSAENWRYKVGGRQASVFLDRALPSEWRAG